MELLFLFSPNEHFVVISVSNVITMALLIKQPDK